MEVKCGGLCTSLAWGRVESGGTWRKALESRRKMQMKTRFELPPNLPVWTFFQASNIHFCPNIKQIKVKESSRPSLNILGGKSLTTKRQACELGHQRHCATVKDPSLVFQLSTQLSFHAQGDGWHSFHDVSANPPTVLGWLGIFFFFNVLSVIL